MTSRIQTVYFFQHTHTDIGYTHPQEEVAERQAENIGRALEYCRRTEDRPPAERFAWTVETGWTLARFWERATEDLRASFCHYARDGRIQITASYVHLTQLATPELLIRSLDPTLVIADACGVTVDTAMSTDINGVNWFYVHLLHQIGVRYLHTAINVARGGAPFPDHRPGGFWWEGPTGEQLLVWNNDHYMTGNWELGFPDAPSYAGLERYLARLDERDYPYDTVIIPVQGYLTDNAPPNLALCDVVADFNRHAGRPLCRFVTLGAALRDIAARYGDQLPVHHGAWPDWWDDGIASSAFQTGLARYAHDDLLAAEKAATLATALGAPNPFPHGELRRLAENLLHYDEHTWGWWRSIEDPSSLESLALGHRKTAYAEDAALEGRRYRDRALQALAARVTPRDHADGERIIVFNPLGWPRRERVRYRVIQRGSTDEDPRAVRMVDGEGHEAPSWSRLERYTGNLVPYHDLWVEFEATVPALGYAIYTIEMTDSPILAPEEAPGHVIENAFYRVEMDESGAVRSLIDKDLGRELVGPGPWSLNQLVYETITSPGGRADTLAQQAPPWNFGPGKAEVARASPTEARVCVVRDGLGATLVSRTSLSRLPRIVQEVRLDDDHKRVDFTTHVVKDEVDAAEALYVAFPLAPWPETVRCDISGGALVPGRDQLAGSATDWYDVRHGVQLSGDGLVLTWLCGEAPLVEFGEMKTGKSPSPPLLENGLLFSYALNNHWFTNFFARQAGAVTLRYRLLSECDGDVGDLGQAGRAFLAPLIVARAVDGEDADATPTRYGRRSHSFAEIVDGQVALDALKPARNGDGWVLRLHEIGGREGPARVRLRWPTPVQVAVCDLAERPVEERSASLTEDDLTADMKPFGTASWRLWPSSL